MSVIGFWTKTQRVLIDNSPTILTAAAVVGTVASAYLSGKAAVRAIDKIRTIEAAEECHLEPREILQETWRDFVPPALTMLATITCIVGANQVGSRRYAGLMAATAITERSFQEYRDKVVEKLGEKKEMAIRDEVAQDRVRDQPVSGREVVIAIGGDVLFMDGYSGRYFESDLESVKSAMNKLNYELNQNYYASLTDFYHMIGLRPTTGSDEVGWNANKLLDLKFSPTIGEGGRPCIVMDFVVVPIRGYHRIS